MLKTDYESRDKLLVAALNVASTELYHRTRSPGPHDDASEDYNDDMLLAAAREFVAKHEDQRTPEEGGPIKSIKDFIRRYFPNAEECPNCNGTGIKPGSDTTIARL